MKLKLKSAGLVGITMALFIIFLFLFIRPIILNDAKMMDQESLEIDSGRVQTYLKVKGEDLQRINRDYAEWDDTYQFLQGQNENYKASNLIFGTFENNAINVIVFINKNNQVIYSKDYDLENGNPLNINRNLSLGSDLLAEINEHDGKLIIYHEKFGPLLFVSEPILTSLGEGPSVGYLIMGKLLDKKFFDNMRNELAVDFRTVILAGEEKESLPANNKENAEFLFERIAIGEGVFVEVKKERKYYQAKLSSLNDLFLSLALGTLLLALLVYYLLDIFVLSRISYLSIQLKDVDFEKPNSLNVRISKKAKDEITNLEQSIQGMLRSLKKAHIEVSKLAYYDQLTGLPNRFNLYREFEKKAKEENSSFSILFFDLDGFKQINDLYGHSSGDELLKEIGLRFTHNPLYERSKLFRLGGDEFIYLSDCSDWSLLLKEVETLMSEIRREFILRKGRAIISSSVGISFFPSDGKTLDDLLQHADSAMYEAKKTGKDSYILYKDLNDRDLYQNGLTLKNDLMNALKLEQLYLEYLPVIDSSRNQIQGLEALVRWNHPEHGIIMPLQFIPLAEEIGVIGEIGEWTVQNAIRDIAEWNRRNNEGFKLAINVSKYQQNFKNELLTVIDHALEENSFAAELLQIEIIENDNVAEDEKMILFIKDLKMRKISVILDDFEAGTSSLFQLIKLDVDIVKIDWSFLKKFPDETHYTVLLKEIYQTLHRLGIEVVTKGIETAHQMELDSTNDTAYVQGRYYSKPISLDELPHLKQRLRSSVVPTYESDRKQRL